MSLKTKIFLSYCIFIISLILLTIFIIHFTVRKTTETIEEKYLIDDVGKLINYLDSEKKNFLGLTKDWAAWTEAWLFMQGRNPKFIENNLNLETFQNNDVFLIAYFDINGRLKKGLEYKEAYNKFIPVEEDFWKKFLERYVSLYDRPDLKIPGFTGFSFKGDMPILVSVHPVLKSDYTGKGVGYLLMGREIKDGKQNLIREIFSFLSFKMEKISERKEVSENKPIIRGGTYKYEVIYSMEDFFGNHTFSIRIEKERVLWNIVKKNLLKLFIFYLFLSLLFGVFFYVWLNNQIINKIKKLIEGVKGVQAEEIDKISIKSKDEIGYLAEVFNDYIQTVKNQINEIEANRKLYEAIAEKSEALIFLFDKNGQILFANPKANEILNKEEVDTAGEDLFNLLNEIIKMNKEEKTFLSEFRLKGGLFISGWIIPIEERESILFIAHDITLLKKEKDKLFERAVKDNLTSLYNRGYFEASVRKLFNNIKKGENYCLLFIDLDDLKKVNDKFGHIIGDEIIKATADSIRKSIREDDLASRWGGDEFVVLIKGKLDIAEKIADRIHKNIQEVKYIFLPEGIKPTVSIGVTVIDDSKDLETIIREADKAAYDAKREGKNRIKIFDPQE